MYDDASATHAFYIDKLVEPVGTMVARGHVHLTAAHEALQQDT